MEIGGLAQVAQRVDDLDRAVDFYGSVLGLALLARFDPPGMAFFDLGGTRLLLGPGEVSSMLYLQVDDVDEMVRRLAGAGVHIEHDPRLVHTDESGHFGPPGVQEWMAFFRDSEQNLVGLVERRAATD